MLTRQPISTHEAEMRGPYLARYIRVNLHTGSEDLVIRTFPSANHFHAALAIWNGLQPENWRYHTSYTLVDADPR